MEKFGAFNKLKKARNIVVLLVVVAIIIVIVSIYRAQTAPPTSAVSNIPGVSGAVTSTEATPSAQKLSPEYLQALLSSQQAQSQQAIAAGKSSIPLIIQDTSEQAAQGQNLSVSATLTNATTLSTVGSAAGPCVQQCMACCSTGGAQTATVLLNQMVQSGALSPSVADELHHLQDNKISADDYAGTLDRLVKEGKLTPEQEQQLLGAYRRQQQLGGVGVVSVSPADDLVKNLLSSGDISADVATELKKAINEAPSADDYKKLLDQMVKDGKLTPEQERQLLAAYRRQQQLGGVDVNSASPADDLVKHLLSGGDISEDTATALKKAIDATPPAGDYNKLLDRMVKGDELTPEQKRQLLGAYRRQQQLGISGVTGASLASPEPGLTQRTTTSGLPTDMINQLQRQGKIDPQSAAMLNALHNQGVSTLDYAKNLNALAGAGKISPQDAKSLLTAYRAEHGDVSVVDAPDKAMAALMKAQQQSELQNQEDALNQLQQSQLTEAAAAQSADIQALQTAISAQTQQLVGAWNVAPQQKITKGTLEKTQKEENNKAQIGQSGSLLGGVGGEMPLVKSGDILFAVLDTTVDTDEPGPIMATIVAGKFKGAKITGSMQRSANNTRVVIKFNSMTMEDWPNMLKINAVAINPDTAKYGLATDVNHHYVQRYGMLFAANFMSGYADSITNAGSTVIGQLSPTLQTHPDLTTSDRLMVAAGKVGKSLSQYANEQFNKPITVKVAAGVGIGVLFVDSLSVAK